MYADPQETPTTSATATTHTSRRMAQAGDQQGSARPTRRLGEILGDVIGAASIIALPFLLLTLAWGFQ